jgi:ribonuclease BN (tRNA processing enzyme)
MLSTTVTIIGSGTCVPSLRRSACSVLIEMHHQKLLFDCGPGTMRRLLEAGIAIFDLTYLFLSHFHPDHTSELVPLLFATKYPDGNQRQKPLTLIGGQGIASFYDGLRAVYRDWIELAPGQLHIRELPPRRGVALELENFRVQASPVEHNPESMAFRVDTPDGKAVVYSGDTDFSPNLVDLARGADLLICESAFPDADKVPGHLSPSTAGEIARQAHVARLVLTHFYPVCDQADLIGECRRTYDGPLVLAEDLLKLRL